MTLADVATPLAAPTVLDSWIDEPKSIEQAFRRYCGSTAGPVVQPKWLTSLLSQISAKVASQWEVGSDGNVARNQRQSLCYWQLTSWMRRRRVAEATAAGSSAPPEVTVCEVGFNAGHSAAVFLSALNHSRGLYYGFDVASDRFLARAVPLLNGTLFPGRLRLTLGESNLSVPLFFASHPSVACDVVSIDGNHNIMYVKADWTNLKRRLRPGGLVLLDDVPFWSRMFIRGKAIYEPELHMVGCVSLPGRADDEESISNYVQQVRQGKRNASLDHHQHRWGHSMVASDGFCIGRRTTAEDDRHAWVTMPPRRETVRHAESGRGSDEGKASKGGLASSGGEQWFETHTNEIVA